MAINDPKNEIKSQAQSNNNLNGVSGIEALRNIDWAVTYTYNVRFDDGTGSLPTFSKWLPAYEVNESLSSIITTPINIAYLQGFELPTGKTNPMISLSLYDTADCEIENWIREWQKEIVNDEEHYIGCLGDIVRKLTITKQNLQRETVLEKQYLVYPKGDIMLRFASTSGEIRVINVQFAVVGIPK